MTTLLKPSTFIPKGIQVEQINNLTLFKFTEELGDRLQDLLDRKKAELYDWNRSRNSNRNSPEIGLDPHIPRSRF